MVKTNVIKAWLLMIGFWVLLSLPSSATAGDIKNVRLGETNGRTRIVVDLSDQATPDVFLLSSPYRLVIDFKGGSYRAPRRLKATGIVKSYRHGLFDSSTYRLVLDLNAGATIASSFGLDPSGQYGHRYVVDLAPASDAEAAKSVAESRKRLAAKRSTRVKSKPRPSRTSDKKLIVIDPGHGGIDPGTLGVLGVNEEHIVLAISKEMKRVLEQSGRYTVRLTRDRDFYLAHRRRFAIAKEIGADLFISVHADSIANKTVRGGTVYTLNESSSDKEAARLAARENKSDVIAGVDLSYADDDVSGILIDLARRDTMNESAVFAEILLGEMREEIRMLKRGHRFANLLVLKSPDVPSVLLEVGFLTNKDDARFLNTKAARRKISSGVLDALDKYFALRRNAAR